MNTLSVFIVAGTNFHGHEILDSRVLIFADAQILKFSRGIYFRGSGDFRDFTEIYFRVL